MAFPHATLLASTTVSVAVYFSLVHCSYSRRPVPPIRASQLRAFIVDGPAPRIEVPIARRGDSLQFTLPSAGTFSLRIESTSHPHLVPATVRVRVMESTVRQRVRVRAISSASRLRLNVLRMQDADGFYTLYPVRAINDRAARKEYVSTFASVVPGSYNVLWVTDHGPELQQALLVAGPDSSPRHHEQVSTLEFSERVARLVQIN